MRLIFVVILAIACFTAQAQDTYNAALAAKLGADDYGMKSYILVMLKTGTNNVTDKTLRDSLFRGHMANIGRLANEGKLVVAGPIGNNNKQYAGIFILNVKTKQEANALLETDPTIKEKVFEAELYEWYGSAALPEYLQYHEQIEKKKP